MHFSKTGYKRNSPDVNKPVNYIAGGSITMKGVDFKVLGIPNKGNAIVMEPGKDYDFQYLGEQITVDLTTLETKYLDESTMVDNQNKFLFKLPHTGTEITYKILTGRDEKQITAEVNGIKKIDKNASPELSTRLKYIITSVEGDTEPKKIREFVDKYMLAQDSRALRNHIQSFQPDVDLTFFPPTGEDKKSLPIGLNFFWPDL